MKYIFLTIVTMLLFGCGSDGEDSKHEIPPLKKEVKEISVSVVTDKDLNE